MAATVTLLGSTFNTTSGTHTVVATPAVNDLIVIIRANTGNTASTTPTDGGGTYTKITSALKATSVDLMEVYVRTALVASAISTTYSDAAGTTTGGGIAVYKVTGMTLTGASSVRSSGAQANQAAATPAPVLSSTPLSSNPIIAAVFNATSPATMTPRTSFTEDADVGYSTPTAGFESMHRNSGETSATLTWGSASGSAFCSIAVELAFNSAPTVALNAPTDTATVATTTPQLSFTGADADSDTVTYEVQVGTITPITDGGTLDQSQSNTGTTGSFQRIQGTGGTGEALGQSFTAAASYTLGTINMNLRKVGSPTDNVYAEIRSTSFSGTVLATSSNVAGSTITGTGGLVAFTFASSQAIANGTKYFVTFSRDGARDTTNYYDTNYYAGGGYAGGGMVWLNSGAWSAEDSTNDANFQVLDKSNATLDKLSNTDTGFTDITNGAHTDPFVSGEQIGYTVQAGNALTNGTTYYWRVRGKDPSGSNTYGAWATTRSFTVSTGGGGTNTSNFFQFF